MRHIASIALLTISVCGCSSPTTPSAPTPVQVAGVWAETGTVTASSGGECFAAGFQTSIGDTFSGGMLTVAQNGSTLTATSGNGINSAICSWTGTAGSNTVSLNLVSCRTNPGLSGVRCDDGSGVRDFRFVSDGVNVTVVGNTATGTETQTYDVLVSGTQNIVSTWTRTFSVSMTRS
jgi:hypothetical protein